MSGLETLQKLDAAAALEYLVEWGQRYRGCPPNEAVGMVHEKLQSEWSQLTELQKKTARSRAPFLLTVSNHSEAAQSLAAYLGYTPTPAEQATQTPSPSELTTPVEILWEGREQSSPKAKRINSGKQLTIEGHVKTKGDAQKVRTMFEARGYAVETPMNAPNDTTYRVIVSADAEFHPRSETPKSFPVLENILALSRAQNKISVHIIDAATVALSGKQLATNCTWPFGPSTPAFIGSGKERFAKLKQG